MRILIAYNGSRIAEEALADLEQAGLPEDVEIDVLSVAESWPVPESEDKAMTRARFATNLLTKRFRFRNVNAQTSSGSPGYEILSRSRSFAPDLIVIGEERTPPADHNLFLRSTSQKVLTEADCSVRIARGYPRRDSSPPRIIIGYDGSPGARIAVEAVVGRHWPPNAEVRLVVVTDSSVLSSIGRFSPQMTNPRIEAKIAGQWAEALAAVPMQRLKNAGLEATLCVESGSPKNVLIKMAEAWNADTIFVGPHCQGNSYERFLLGSVSASVAACAHCSVEVVRKQDGHGTNTRNSIS